MTSSGEQGETGNEYAQPEVTLQIADDVPAEHRDAIQASVATLARRSAEAAQRAFERRQAKNQLRTAMAGSLRKLIEEDPDASKASAAVRRQLEQERSDQPTEEGARPTVEFVERLSQAAAADSLAPQIFGLPFHYSWQWHVPELVPPFSSFADRSTGRIELDTFANDERHSSTVHAGVGVSLNSASVQNFIGRVRRTTEHRFVLTCDFTGNATAEGGIEITFLEQPGNIFLERAEDKRFRRRISNGDDNITQEFTGLSAGQQIEVRHTVQPGPVYTFNVGFWLFCEAHDGFASAQIRGNALTLEATFIP
jgi:hypothetical protein